MSRCEEVKIFGKDPMKAILQPKMKKFSIAGGVVTKKAYRRMIRLQKKGWTWDGRIIITWWERVRSA